MGLDSAVEQALQRVAGTPRVVVYDVPVEDRPVRVGPATPFVIGGGAWWRYVKTRKQLDDGWFTLLISLRHLPEEEALLAVDWGTVFANAFLLVEPKHPIDAGGGAAVRGARDEDWLRSRFGVWRYWRLTPGSSGRREAHSEVFDLTNGRTIVDVLQERLPRVFPPESFRAALVELNAREADLFIGHTVGRVVVPFLTRLGLPTPYDPSILVDATRRLVNAGLAWVEDPEGGQPIYHGPDRPLPDDLPDTRFQEMRRV